MACIHDIEDANSCAYCKKGKKNSKTSKKKRVSKSTGNAVKTTLCQYCKAKPRVLRTEGKCKSCATKWGYKTCAQCKKMFLPSKPNIKKCGCRKKTGKRSVWAVASAGLPSLGRRR